MKVNKIRCRRMASDVLSALTAMNVPADLCFECSSSHKQSLCINLLRPARTNIRNIAEYEMEIKTSI